MRLDQIITHRDNVVHRQLRRSMRIQHGRMIDMLVFTVLSPLQSSAAAY